MKKITVVALEITSQFTELEPLIECLRCECNYKHKFPITLQFEDTVTIKLEECDLYMTSDMINITIQLAKVFLKQAR